MNAETSIVPAQLGPPDETALRKREMLRGVSVHLATEHAFLADLFAMPSPTDLTLVCTNVRTPDGKRPVWSSDKDSIYYFPWAHIRFIEIPETAHAAGRAGGGNRAAGDGGARHAEPERETELEIDEDFLRRVRDV